MKNDHFERRKITFFSLSNSCDIIIMGEKHTNNNKNLHEILKQHFVYNLNSNWKKT